MTSLGFSPYESYKDSCVDWIGSIPSTWDVQRAKWLFKRMDRAVRPEDDIVTCFRDGEVTLRNNRRTEGFTTALKEIGYQGIRKGDLVIHAMDAFAGAIGVSDSDGKSTPVYAACVPRLPNTVVPSFYAYYMRHLALSGFLVSLAKGIRERSTDFRFNDFAELEVPFPPLAVQRAIVTFLDEKCAKIDEAVKIKDDQIALLRERRQIIIQNAVTRGMNPSAPMKESGIDWIGVVPSHWEVRRFRFLCDITTGRNTEHKVEDGEYPFFVRSQTAERINSYSFDGEAVLTAGDGAGVGKIYHYYDGKFDFHQRVYKFSNFREVCGKYVFHYLDANFFNVALLGMAKSTVDSLRLPLIQNFWVAFPPDYDEQELILKAIDLESKKIDNGIAIKERQIAALKEYKTSLINAAVTGKIKVA